MIRAFKMRLEYGMGPEFEFRDIVLSIERNQSPYMIMDGDRPVAQIVPVAARRKIVTIPELAGSISKEDLFSGDSDLWEAVNA